ncbi:MAG: PIN domain-containing protein [Nanoarchaeota archaeon]|mgnify:CR=1 FL=1
MKQAILDTSFIITCVKQKIDFFEKMELEGIEIIIPLQVINELKGLKSNISLKLLEKNSFKKIDLKTKNVDEGIKNFAYKNKNAIVATLDRGLKMKIRNPKLVIRGTKKLEIL